MALNDLTINFTDGNLNPQLPGEDHISGLVAYTGSVLPDGFATDDRVKPVFSLTEAESLGITDDADDTEILLLHYALKEAFRINPGMKIWVGCFAAPSSFDFAEITTLQRAASGQCRRIGVLSLNQDQFTTAHVTSIQTICNTLKSEHMPVVVFLEANPGNWELSTDWPDLSELTAPNVGVVIGADAGNEGAALSTSTTVPVGMIGAVIGAHSKALAHESIGWVSKFNLVTGKELDTPSLISGELIKNLSAGALGSLQDYRYIFPRKHVGISGTYLNDSLNANVASSDYNAIERITVANKAYRLLRAAYLPTLSGPILLEGGLIQKDVVAALRAQGGRALDQMLRTGEISEYTILVDPDQDIVNTSTLEIAAKVVPVGVARNIIVNFSFNVTV